MGFITTQVFPLEMLVELKVVASQPNEATVEQAVGADQSAEQEAADADSPPMHLDGEHKLIIGRTDTTESEFDLTRGSWLFEVRDSEGATIYSGDNSALLVEGFCIAHIEYEKARMEKLKAFRDLQNKA